METWMDRDANSATYWILPACNFTGNFELTVGGGWRYKSRSTQNTQVALQGKTIFKPLEANGWGLGLVAGTLWHPKEMQISGPMGSTLIYPSVFHSKTTESWCTAISAGIVTARTI